MLYNLIDMDGQYGQIFVMLIIFLISIFLFIKRRDQKSRLYAMLGCLFCFIGDILLALSVSWRLIPGAVSFVIAHVILGVMYYRLLKEEELNFFNWGFITGAIVSVITLIVIETLAFTIVAKPNTLIAGLMSIYIIAIGFNMSLNFSYAVNKKGTFYFLMLGMIIFYATDLWIFLGVLDISNVMRGYVWYFYQVGQLLLVLFNAPLEFKKKE